MTEDTAESKASNYIIWISNSHLKPNKAKPELLFSPQNLAPHINSACQQIAAPSLNHSGKTL